MFQGSSYNTKEKIQTNQKILKKEMQQIRILQRDLVYISGLPPQLACEKILKSKQFYGQYGKIKSLLVCKQKPIKSKKFQDYVYITYENTRDASLAILATNLLTIDGSQIKVSFGMTRFCKDFIEGKKCQKKQKCTYVHSVPPLSEITSNHCRKMNKNLRNVGEKETVIYYLSQSYPHYSPQITNSEYSVLPNIDFAFLKIKKYLKNSKKDQRQNIMQNDFIIQKPNYQLFQQSIGQNQKNCSIDQRNTYQEQELFCPTAQQVSPINLKMKNNLTSYGLDNLNQCFEKQTKQLQINSRNKFLEQACFSKDLPPNFISKQTDQIETSQDLIDSYENAVQSFDSQNRKENKKIKFPHQNLQQFDGNLFQEALNLQPQAKCLFQQLTQLNFNY